VSGPGAKPRCGGLYKKTGASQGWARGAGIGYSRAAFPLAKALGAQPALLRRWDERGAHGVRPRAARL